MEALVALQASYPDQTFELLYGGSKGGGKTVFGDRWSYIRAKEIIKEFDLKASRDIRKLPMIGFMGRKRGTDFAATTMNTWKREIPANAYQFRHIDGKVPVMVIENKALLMYGGMDNQETVKKFNSAELMFYFVDQAEELDEIDVAMLRGTLRLKLGPRGQQRPPKDGYKGLLTANPAQCFLKSTFIDEATREDNTSFIQALPADNPFLPAGYIDNLRRAYRFNPALARAYIEGSWDELDQVYIIIPRRHVEACIDAPLKGQEVRKVTAVDIAESGEDETVIYDFENHHVVNEEIYAHRDLMDTVGRIVVHAKQNGSNFVSIDKVGVGAGVLSRAQEVFREDRNVTVHGFDGRVMPPGPRERSKGVPPSIEQKTYANYRAYAWFNASTQIFAERKFKLHRDPQLIRQLSGVTYHFTSGGKLIVDDKEELKKKLGSSPDRGDCLVMGIDALSQAKPIKRRDAWDEPKKYKYRFNPDTV